jgi:hypothetical protein
MSLRTFLMALITVAGVIFAFCAPRFGDAALSAVERFGVRLAQRKGLAIVSIAVAAVLLRLSLLSWVSVPAPGIHDEFSYLLASDTFAHGRLTNPPHPMWIYFDTFHELQNPTYMSKYPPAQGVCLALGQILGHPWIGVLLSTAGMCAAVLWALQGWLPARWALLAGFLVLFRFALFGQWINSYWGGSVPALGGALVIGSLPRIIHSRRPRDAAILGIGATALALSRPFEGFVFCIPVFAVLLAWLWSRKSPSLSETVPRTIVPILAILILCGTFMAYYNWRVTGSPIVFPYVLYERTHTTLPLLQWQKASAPIQYQNPQFEAFHDSHSWATVSSMQGRIRGFRSFVSVLAFDTRGFVSFYLWPEFFFVLLVTFPWVVRDRRVRLPISQTLFCIGGFLLAMWFQPHYAAALTATVFCLTGQGTRHLRKWQLGGRPIGIGLTRAIVLLVVALTPFHQSSAYNYPSIIRRAEIEQHLAITPGQHLVIVRYSPRHDPLQEWVYNRADIDHAKVVWAREIPGIPTEPLLTYFHRRRVWLLEADASQAVIVPYPKEQVSK